MLVVSLSEVYNFIERKLPQFLCFFHASHWSDMIDVSARGDCNFVSHSSRKRDSWNGMADFTRWDADRV